MNAKISVFVICVEAIIYLLFLGTMVAVMTEIGLLIYRYTAYPRGDRHLAPAL